MFNGKELDEETGLYYYGSRYYDGHTSIWLSVDPKAERSPNESSYIYTSNNPVIYVDPDGQFKIPIHQSITRTAMQSISGLGNYAKLDIVLGVGFRADVIGGFADNHFDGRSNFKQIKETWTELNQDINNINFGSFNKQQGGQDAVRLGRKLHTVQYFYSHSNYVDLYIEFYKSENNGKMPNDVPTFDEEMKLKGSKL